MIMAPESNPSLTPCPRRRPRAATTMHPTTPLGPPAISLSQSPAGDYSGLGTASGPLRHPKPLTPSDLHSMVEREQEAMVNRLSRELSILRQQTASVASTTSSTSTTFNDPIETLHSSPYLGTRHRSSSSLSSSYIPAVQESRAGNIGIAATRENGLSLSRPGRSRQQSFNSVQPSGSASPSLSSSLQQVDHFPRRRSVSHTHVTSPTAISRLEETAQHCGDFESIKRENEALRQRVRDLELALKKSQERGPTSPKAS
ncbi:uncharacterized protein ACHE_40975A [Aspergillus chevalieri]|uniref:Uncharacterized protein n=1 Tax=Aspergillus chevalieri TaxID=182096 RepID=A0A7R7VPF1_ASPCH|nr:uncharacterized protein ACHE_40975A [Aspergillus chevalieri]BCR88411.1 hypothetical protein ACHE_40975A [Aspergillus chevalieri]